MNYSFPCIPDSLPSLSFGCRLPSWLEKGLGTGICPTLPSPWVFSTRGRHWQQKPVCTHSPSTPAPLPPLPQPPRARTRSDLIGAGSSEANCKREAKSEQVRGWLLPGEPQQDSGHSHAQPCSGQLLGAVFSRELCPALASAACGRGRGAPAAPAVRVAHSFHPGNLWGSALVLGAPQEAVELEGWMERPPGPGISRTAAIHQPGSGAFGDASKQDLLMMPLDKTISSDKTPALGTQLFISAAGMSRDG